MRMFSVYLPDGNFDNNGIGPALLSGDLDGFFFLPLTVIIEDRIET